MGLTRIRAQQISDIDYKQSVRVITLTDITLSGGAPATVDGVSLLTGDRILVAGQSNAAQNGLYQVQILGTGSDGTWVRTSDANQDGEIQPGMVVMVTQGTEYADTPWKLVTNGEIIIGTTELTFEENYSLAFGNVYANGTAVIASTVSAPLTLEAGDNIAITGNNTSKTVTIAVTGINLDSIANGTSNVAIPAANSNVTVGVNGIANVAVFAQHDITLAANVLPSANVTFDLGTDTQRWRDIYLANSTIYLGSAEISANATSLIFTNPEGAQTVFSGATSDIAADSVMATGNITAGNLSVNGESTFAGNLLPTANITYDLGSDTARWNDLWLANSTIHIGNGQISANATSLTLTNPDGSAFEPAGNFANLTILTRSTGNVNFGLNFGSLEVVGRTGNISIPLAA